MSVVALKVVEQKDDRHLYVTEKAAEFLPTIGRPLKVVSLWGSGRTGKTYNIQRMVQLLSGVAPENVDIIDMREDVYKIGNSLTPVTNGIDGIFVPFSVTTQYADQPGTLLFIDLEGSNNPFSPHQPIELQVLALMSTSCLTLVDRGNPTLKSVLELAHACTEVITRYMKDNARDTLTLKPNWLWLLNDTDLVDTVDDPLDALLAGNEEPEAVALREQLENCFEERGFECLPNLYHEERYLQELQDETSWIINHLGKLMLGGIELDGKEYLHLITESAKNINENEVVDVEPAFLAIARTHLVEIRETNFSKFEADCPEIEKYQATLGRSLSKMKKQSLEDYESETAYIRTSAGAEETYLEERAILEGDIDAKIAHLEEVNSQAKRACCANCSACCTAMVATICVCKK